MSTIAERLQSLNIILPVPAAPVANYVPYVLHGDMLAISGQVTMENGERKFIGRLGGKGRESISLEDGQKAARLCAINIISQIKAALAGDLERVVKLIRLGVFVNAAPDFTDQSLVANGASDLMVAVFGDAGRHTRAAVGVSALPGGVAVEVDALLAVKPAN
jgi:enamine deaminase RidA (YjgF/YER057c/UK114 family)